MPNNNGSRLIAISVASILSAGTAIAADAPAPDSSELTEVVVTANKLNATKVLDTPASIQALSGDALQSAGASGIMDIAGENRRLVFQAVHMILEGDFQQDWRTQEKRYSRMVLIGRNLDEAKLREGFESTVA